VSAVYPLPAIVVISFCLLNGKVKAETILVPMYLNLARISALPASASTAEERIPDHGK